MMDSLKKGESIVEEIKRSSLTTGESTFEDRSGWTAEASTVLEKKEDWPGWETEAKLGKGAFGTVYKIRRTMLGLNETRALKIISIPRDSGELDSLRELGLNDNSIRLSLEERAKRIAEEYRVMQLVRENPNIVQCFDLLCEQTGNVGWVIKIQMELLTPVSKALEKLQSEEQTIQLGKDICNALISCHEKKIIHRDIKPQNILVSNENVFKLGDFGIAGSMDVKSFLETKAGAVPYMAPEIYRGEKYGRTVDIYSLGLVLYWLLNEQRLPFYPLPPKQVRASDMEEAVIRRLRGEKFPFPKNGSKQLKEIVLKACSYNPKDRYQTAEEMLKALASLDTPVIDLNVYRTVTLKGRKKPESVVVSGGNGPVLVSVPENVRDGQFVQIPGGGRTDPVSGQVGDLVVTFRLKTGFRSWKLLIAVGAVGLVLLGGVIGMLLPTDGAAEPAAREKSEPVVGKEVESATETFHTSTKCTTHVWNVPQCGELRECALCGYRDGETGAHMFMGAAGSQWCIRCEKTENEILSIETLLLAPESGMVVAGNYHSVYLHSDGTVAAVGRETSDSDITQGTRLDTDDWESIVMVSASNHTVGLKTDGTVIAVGDNQYGQCDVEKWRKIISIDTSEMHTVGLCEDGTVVAVGRNESGQCNVSGWKNIKAVAASNNTTYGLMDDGTVVATGGVNYAKEWTNIQNIAAGPYHVVGLTEDGFVKQGGKGAYGNPVTSNWTNVVSISAGNMHTLAVRENGEIYAWGMKESGAWSNGYLNIVRTWKNVVQISAGLYHTIGLTEDGFILVEGSSNAYGQENIAGLLP